ncbi:hypothetical protein Pmani_011466 [Petrolisthes manimaculis]|uniref:Uncharacterized protein n=1 Tax=Petrolisthes manimaculis TaxID=1843537 RepID=A0AAE1UG57_9EUCA|nr:hypothetical protein Pmani_011466 [Petrolisthes manimaculis]
MQPKPGDSCDSPDSVALQYDQPANLKFDYNIPGYAYCHFVLDYETDFDGFNIGGGLSMEYYEAFKHCESRNCVGIVCNKGGSGEFSCVLSWVFNP